MDQKREYKELAISHSLGWGRHKNTRKDYAAARGQALSKGGEINSSANRWVEKFPSRCKSREVMQDFPRRKVTLFAFERMRLSTELLSISFGVFFFSFIFLLILLGTIYVDSRVEFDWSRSLHVANIWQSKAWHGKDPRGGGPRGRKGSQTDRYIERCFFSGLTTYAGRIWGENLRLGFKQLARETFRSVDATTASPISFPTPVWRVCPARRVLEARPSCEH